MPNSTYKSIEKFVCQGLTVHFIYSFSFMKKLKRKKVESYFVGSKDILDGGMGAIPGTPDNRVGIMPHINFELDSEYVEYEPMQIRIEDCPECNLYKTLRTFRSANTCCLSVEIPRDPEHSLDTNKIQRILGLVKLKVKEGKKNFKKRKITVVGKSGRKGTLYDHFYRTIKEFTDKNKELILLSEEFGLKLEEEVQSPWVITVAEVDGPIADAFCEPSSLGDDPARSKMLLIRRYEHEIASIVFRQIGSEMPLEPAYTNPPTPNSVPGLFSMGLDARLYVNMSRRSILCICRNKNEDPAQFFIPELLNLCEFVRSRWYMLIMMNRVLDHRLGDMRKKAETGELTASDEVYQIMKFREWLLTCLEDPGIYVIAGDALSNLSEELSKTFRINELCELVLKKFDLYDRFYRNIQEWEWLDGRRI